MTFRSTAAALAAALALAACTGMDPEDPAPPDPPLPPTSSTPAARGSAPPAAPAYVRVHLSATPDLRHWHRCRFLVAATGRRVVEATFCPAPPPG